LEENVETEIEKKIGVKINELMKEVDEIITFLKALGEDVGLRLNKLFAQVDNVVAPLTNTVIKMEEAADHLTTFRETSERVLEDMKKFREASKQATDGVSSFKMPELDVVTRQVNDVRNESSKALETVKLINEAAAQAVQSGTGSAAPAAPGGMAAISDQSQKALEAMRSIEEMSVRLSEELKSSIRDATDSALAAIRDVQSRAKQGQYEAPVEQIAPPKETQARGVREAPTSPKGGPPLPPRPETPERETRTVPAQQPGFAPAPSPPPAKAAAAPTTRIYSSSAEQVFNPIEESLNSTAGALAKAILDVRDRIMGMTRKFGAIYDLASTARELARYPQRTLDRREKEVIMEKLTGWRAKLAEAMIES
jgi:hypothetical protein